MSVAESIAPAPSEAPLPQLRAELQILDAGHSGADGGAVIFDPLRMRYFRFDRETAELLSEWSQCRVPSELVERVNLRFGSLIAAADVAALAEFLALNQLVMPATEKEWRTLVGFSRRSRQGWLTWAMHNYLFAKIPLLRPQPALQRAAPWLAPLYTRSAAIAIALIGLVGLYLASRQWDQFLATFSHLWSLEGAALYIVAIAIVKSLHEIGHAVTAVRYGCRVPAMGLCFMVMVPMLYTDVTDAWRLRSSRQRLAIDAAGIVVETAIASLATFAWAFLPDGIGRSLAFATATTGWLVSLGMNLNPLMRFDGYYILSDFFAFENLQPRAFAVGRWRLREILFGFGRPPPEALHRRTLGWLSLYAYAVWLYRLVLFTGIALLVYHMAFKLLGIVLFAIEIVFFIALPIWHELKEWQRMRASIVASPRALVPVVVLGGVFVSALVPWSTSIAIPAIIEAEDVVQTFPKRPAHVIRADATVGATIGAGHVLAELASPELEQDIRLAQARIRLVSGRIARRAGDAAEKSETLVLADTLASLEAKLRGLEEERAELRIVSDRAGVIAEADTNLHAGRWLERGNLIAVVRAGDGESVRGYVAEDHVARIDLAASALFVPEDLTLASREVRLGKLAAVGTAAMDLPELASHYGGGVASRSKPAADGGASRTAEHTPVAGQFMIIGKPVASINAPRNRVVRGTLHAHGKPESLAARAWRQILKVLVRESGL